MAAAHASEFSVDAAHKRSNHTTKWGNCLPSHECSHEAGEHPGDQPDSPSVDGGTGFAGEVLPAWIAEHDFRPPAVVLDAMRTTIDRADLGYTYRHTDVAGAFADWAKLRYGWCLDPELAVTCVDALQGVTAAVTALTEPGEGVILTPPIYHIFGEICPTSKRRQAEWLMRRNEHGWQFDPEDLEELLRNDPQARVLLLSHPHNPTGRVADRETLSRIVELAHVHDIYIVSDEIHGDLVYPPASFVPLLSIPGAAERVVTVTSPAKTFAISGLRCALMVYGDRALRDRIRQAHPPLLLGHASRTGIDATIAAWTEPSARAWVDRLTLHLQGLRDHLVQRLASEAPAVGIHSPESTFLAWLDLRATGLGDRPAARLLQVAGVAGSEGCEFGTNGSGHLRLNFGTSQELLDEIIDRLVPHLQG